MEQIVTEFHIGLDDTDSRTGGCTTYTAAVLFDELCRKGFTPSDFPWLVRLNPNIPWKTRGNGALAIHLQVNSEDIASIRQVALETIIQTTDLSAPRADPAVVFLVGPVPRILREYSTRALHDVLSVGEARTVAKSGKAEIHPIKGTRGIIGSLAAIGAELQEHDHTFEIIAYRSGDSLGKPRRVNLDSVRKMDSELSDRTFHSVDPETGRVLVCPHGPDPVLLGIRGVDPEAVMEAFRRVEVQEPIERVMIFRTNQGTESHLRRRHVSDLRPFQSAVLSGRVETVPRTLRGGHVVFSLHDGTGTVDCLAFEPTGSLNRIARELLPGDVVEVSGGVRHRRNRTVSLNLEKIEIQELTNAFRRENPQCQRCGGRCESMGRNQGFRCRKCGLRDRNLVGSIQPLERNLSRSVYIPSPRARRHLTKPYAIMNSKIV